MISGATPAVAYETNRPMGLSPSWPAFRLDVTTAAAAPSLFWLLFPAVTEAVLLENGFSGW